MFHAIRSSYLYPSLCSSTLSGHPSSSYSSVVLFELNSKIHLWKPYAIYAIYAMPQPFNICQHRTAGGKRVLLFAVALWSLATMLAPSAATVSTEVFIASRVLVGIGEGLAPAAGLRMVATWVPEAERSRAVATLGAGKTGGSIAGLLLAPVVIGAFGWQAMFYSFGVLGLFWAAV